MINVGPQEARQTSTFSRSMRTLCTFVVEVTFEACFLGLGGDALFRKLVVVQRSPKDHSMGGWEESIRVESFDGTPLGAQVLVQTIVHALETPSELQMNRNGPHTATVTTGRYADEEAVVLLVGHTGHGKSKTIDRLVRETLLQVGESTLGSTTKVIQRVKVPMHIGDTAFASTVVFDDTPGLEDSTHTIQGTIFPNTIPQTYPDVILLVASWESITPDANNDPVDFTSAVGNSMYNLFSSGLVDHTRANVVIVVTKSMSFRDQFDDFESDEEKNAQWNLEAEKTQDNHSSPSDESLPELGPMAVSHENLLKAIGSVIQHHRGQGPQDPAGMQNALSGTAPAEQPVTEILVDRPEEMPNLERFSSTSPSVGSRIREVTDSVLGVTYDPTRGSFGRSRVIDFKQSDVRWRRCPRSNLEFEQAVQTERKADIAILRAQDFSWAALQSASSTESKRHVLRHIVTEVAVYAYRLQLSREMKEQIQNLPPWNDVNSKQEYTEFFSNYGTHVVTRLAVGGVIRVLVDSADEDTNARTLDSSGAIDATSAIQSSHTRNVMVSSEGGSGVASRLPHILESHFAHAQTPSPEFQKICTQWIEELERDPVFCSDDPTTEYRYLYSFHGLAKARKDDLKHATKFYLNQLAEGGGVKGVSEGLRGGPLSMDGTETSTVRWIKKLSGGVTKLTLPTPVGQVATAAEKRGRTVLASGSQIYGRISPSWGNGRQENRGANRGRFARFIAAWPTGNAEVRNDGAVDVEWVEGPRVHGNITESSATPRSLLGIFTHFSGHP
ncbi:hypothetical protein C8J57DRAFT_1248171 [Mycena rebaudengoi]|nr:hypothetical protein C8J57DRAFT_1248171 [Mycena rebaudengoi]